MSIDAVLRVLDSVRPAGPRKWSARCPAHDDQIPSLSIAEGENGRTLLHCHSGCAPEDVLEAVGLTWADLHPDRTKPFESPSGLGEVDAVYPYSDESGELLYEVVRFAPKSFRQRRPDGDGGYVWSVSGVRRVLYGLPQVMAALESGETLYVTEGEKDADTLERHGVIATTFVGGAGKIDKTPDGVELLARSKRVVIVADADRPGREHAHALCSAINEAGGRAEAFEPVRGNDVTDVLETHGIALSEALRPLSLAAAGSSSDRRSELRSADQGVPAQVLDPGQFFHPRDGLRHESLVEAVLDEGLVAAGLGRQLWYYADGVWRPNGEDEVRRRCQRLLRDRTRVSHVEGVVRHFQAHEPLIDDKPQSDYINCRSGLLDWRTGELHDHTPIVRSTWQIPVEWKPNSSCPTVDKWVDEVAPDDAANLVWQVIGAALYGDLPVHKAVLLFGPGRNGKGTLLRLIEALVGKQHCAAVSLQALAENRFAAADLYGKAVNLAGDLDARAVTRTDVFKMVTGGDTIHAERKYAHPFTFTNRALMVFAANELPGTVDHTDGFHSRWIVVPFTKTRLAPRDIDPTLEPRMHAELEGVFVKAVAGLQSLMESGGFDEPLSVTEATTAYRQDTDPVRRFVDSTITITGRVEDRETRYRIFKAYKQWCDDENSRPYGAQRFWGRIRTVDDRINVDGGKVGGQRIVTGVRLDD